MDGREVGGRVIDGGREVDISMAGREVDGQKGSWWPRG